MGSWSDGEDERDEMTYNEIDLTRPKVMECNVGTCGRCLNPADEQDSGWRVAALVRHLVESIPTTGNLVA